MSDKVDPNQRGVPRVPPKAPVTPRRQEPPQPKPRPKPKDEMNFGDDAPHDKGRPR